MLNTLGKYLFCLVLFASCIKTDQKTAEYLSKYALKDSGCAIPDDMADIIDIPFIANLFDKEEQEIEFVPNVTSEFSYKGFYIWDYAGANNGVFISIRKNAHQDSGDDFAAQMVKNVKEQGESDNQGISIIYDDFPGPWSDGAYNFQAFSYVWQLDNCILFKIMINASLNKKEQLDIAYSLANEINDNYWAMMLSSDTPPSERSY